MTDKSDMEIPVIAPQTGAKIIDAKEKEPDREITRGVKRVGGGDHGKDAKGVRRVGNWNRP